MTQVQLSPAGRAVPVSLPVSLFFVGAAGVMVVFTFIGFSEFYLHGMAHPNRPIAPPIKALVIGHGVSMSVWLGLLLLQPILIQSHQTKLHMRMGIFGAILAAVSLVLGTLVAVRSAQVAPADNIVWGLEPKPFMAIPFLTILLFGAFVAAGVAFRRKPRIHRSMMVVGTLAATSAAISRIEPLNSLYVGTVIDTIFGPFFWTIVLGALLCAARCMLTKTLDRPFLSALVIMSAALVAIMQFAKTEVWYAIATALAG